MSTAQGMLQRLNDNAKDHKSYDKALGDAAHWLAQMDERVQDCNDTSGDWDTIRDRINGIEQITASMDEGSQLVYNVCDLAKKILPNTSSDRKRIIEQEVTKLTIEWEKLEQAISECYTMLEGVQERWNEYEEYYGSLVKWLADTDHTLQMKSEPIAQLVEKKTQLDKFKLVLSDVENHHRLVNELAERVANLEALSENTDVSDSLSDVQSRYDRVRIRAMEIVAKLDRAYHEHLDFHEAQQEIEKWLLQTSFKFMSHNSINFSSIEITQRQLDKHSAVIRDKEDYRMTLDMVNKKGHHLAEDNCRVSKMASQIQSQLRNLEESYLNFQSTAAQIKALIRDIEDYRMTLDMVNKKGRHLAEDNCRVPKMASQIQSQLRNLEESYLNLQSTAAQIKDEKGETDEVVKSKTKKKKKKKKKKDSTDKYHETTKTTIHSVETMNILSDLAKSVGHIIGPKESGTCWRVGNDKIITAAHVVVGNIWHQLIRCFFERDLEKFRVDFEYIYKESSSHDQFKVVPRVLFMDESLDVAVLQLKPDEKKPFPPPLKMFHVLNLEKDDDKQIYLISHNQGKKKEVNSGIGIWKPTEKKLQDLEKFCQQYGEENGYLGLERKDRLVIQCDFVGGASGSPGIVILNSVAYVILVYIRGFPSFYHSQKFSKEQRRKFPTYNLFQHGVNIENLFAAMSNGVDNILLRDEIFLEEALKLEQNINQHHKLAISGDKKSSYTETTETSTEIVKGKMDNISEKSETKIPISTGTACTDQSEDNIPDAANYNRLMSHNSVPGRTFITSPQDDTDRYTITGNQSAQDIKTGGSDICTVQDQGNHTHASKDNVAAKNHNLHTKEGEIISLQRSPGNTRPVSAEQISIDEWVGH